MNCPYCESSLSHTVKVCPHCTRDLWMIQALQKEVHELREQLASLQGSLIPAPLIGDAQSQASFDPPLATDLSPAGWRLVGAALVSIALAMGLHGLLLFVFDVNPWVLRIATIVLPAMVSAWALRTTRLLWPAVALTSVMTGTFAVWGMLAVTGLIDNVPVAPQNLRDLRETLEYGLAMALGFLTGALAVGWWRLMQKPLSSKTPSGLLVLLVRRDAQGRLDIDAIINEVQKIITLAGPLVSGGMAVYSGFKSLMG